MLKLNWLKGDIAYFQIGLVFLTCTAIAWSTISSVRSKMNYRKAEIYAEKQFGDQKPPLDETERQEWHEYMGASNKPTNKQLKEYREERSALENLTSE